MSVNFESGKWRERETARRDRGYRHVQASLHELRRAADTAAKAATRSDNAAGAAVACAPEPPELPSGLPPPVELLLPPCGPGGSGRSPVEVSCAWARAKQTRISHRPGEAMSAAAAAARAYRDAVRRIDPASHVGVNDACPEQASTSTQSSANAARHTIGAGAGGSAAPAARTAKWSDSSSVPAT